MLRRHLFSVCMLLMCFCASAQVNLTPVEADSMLRDIHSRVSKLNNHDPELISLHYLFAKDLEKELKQFYDKVLPALKETVSSVDYYAVLNHYDRVSFYARNVKDTLAERKKRVDSLFYVLAFNEMVYENHQEAKYFIDRALEYNPLYTNALILKLNLLYDENQFDDCIDVIHILYNEATLNREQEMQISDFTLDFYNKLYSIGDSLVRVNREAEALEVFTTLEEFCHNMPSNYCNDDYYKGILRSKTGVYNSYLAIAEVAIKRKNAEMASQFVEYAKQYENDNPGEIQDNSKLLQVESDLRRLTNVENVAKGTEVETEEFGSDEVYQQEVIKQKKESLRKEAQAQLQSDFRLFEKQIECERLFVEGINECYHENYGKAYELLSKAKALGTCNSELLDKLLDSLKKLCE